MGINTARRWRNALSAVVVVAAAVPGGGALASTGSATTAEQWNPCPGAASPAHITPATGSGSVAATQLEQFRALAAEPSLTIDIPPVTLLDGTTSSAWINAAMVDGGVLISARVVDPISSGQYGTALTVVNHDGTVRWTKCIAEDLWAVGAVAGSASAVLAAVSPDEQNGAAQVKVLSLADGAITADLTERVSEVASGTRLLATTPAGMFFGLPFDSPITADTKLARVDLATAVVDSRPVPPAAVGTPEAIEFDVTQSGYLTVRIGAVEQPVSAVLYEGEWVTDAATTETAAGPFVDFDYQASAAHLERQAADGSTMWERPDVGDTNREGFHVGVTQGVVLANTCGEPNTDPTAECDGALVGIDAATGETLWTLPELHGVAEFGNGLALVTDDSGYVLINARTGTELDASQHWGLGVFSNECCGEGDYVFTRRFGAVVVAVNHEQVRVFYPADVAPPATTVTPFSG